MKFNLHKAKKMIAKGRAQDAVNYALQVTTKSRTAWEAHIFLAEVGMHTQDWRAAEQQLTQAQKISAQEPAVIAAIGEYYLLRGKTDQGIAALEHAVQTTRNPVWLDKLGSAYAVQEKHAQAVACAEEAYALDPQNPVFAYNLAARLMSHIVGFDVYLRVRGILEALRPGSSNLLSDAKLYTRLANVCFAVDDLPAAKDYAEKATRAYQSEPEKIDALLLQALLESTAGDTQTALATYDTALTLDPDAEKVHKSKGKLLLLLEQFSEGWHHFNQGLEDTSLAAFRKKDVRRGAPWRGEDISKDHIMVRDYMGLGEQVFFASMMSELNTHCASLVCVVEPRLVKLMTRSLPEITFMARADSDTAFQKSDRVLYAPEVAAVLRPNLGAFPKPKAFLVPDPDLRQVWSDWLKTLPGRPIGLSWFSRKYANSTAKGPVTLEDWLPLVKTPGIAWIDLQYGEADGQRDWFADQGISLIRPPDLDLTQDIEGVTALLSALDGLVTISNSTAHLSAAVGTPTHLLLSHMPFWHWGISRSDNLWYPSIKAYRAQNTNDWGRVVAQVAEALET